MDGQKGPDSKYRSPTEDIDCRNENCFARFLFLLLGFFCLVSFARSPLFDGLLHTSVSFEAPLVSLPQRDHGESQAQELMVSQRVSAIRICLLERYSLDICTSRMI